MENFNKCKQKPRKIEKLRIEVGDKFTTKWKENTT